MKEHELKLLWKATLDNGVVLSQFNSNGTETKFQDVIDNFDNLDTFELKHVSIDLLIKVDLINGLITLNDYKSATPDNLKKQKHNIRLIYFRRNNVDINIKGEILRKTTTYFIGYQYNDINGQNRKVLLNIDELGNIILGDM